MARKIHVILLPVIISMMLSACTVNVNINTDETKEAATINTQEASHSQATLALKQVLDDDPALMSMMVKSIAKAHEINPDPDTGPVTNVEELYDFIDHNIKGLPWNLLTDAEYPTMYDHIDQSIDYIWFLMDQPLDELKGKGYYYPTLQYHEPIAS